MITTRLFIFFPSRPGPENPTWHNDVRVVFCVLLKGGRYHYLCISLEIPLCVFTRLTHPAVQGQHALRVVITSTSGGANLFFNPWVSHWLSCQRSTHACMLLKVVLNVSVVRNTQLSCWSDIRKPRQFQFASFAWQCKAQDLSLFITVDICLVHRYL